MGHSVIEVYAAVSGVVLGWEIYQASAQGRFAIFLTFIAFNLPLICLYLLSMVS